MKFLLFLAVLFLAIVLGGKWLASWAERTGSTLPTDRSRAP